MTVLVLRTYGYLITQDMFMIKWLAVPSSLGSIELLNKTKITPFGNGKTDFPVAYCYNVVVTRLLDSIIFDIFLKLILPKDVLLADTAPPRGE